MNDNRLKILAILAAVAVFSVYLYCIPNSPLASSPRKKEFSGDREFLYFVFHSLNTNQVGNITNIGLVGNDIYLVGERGIVKLIKGNRP